MEIHSTRIARARHAMQKNGVAALILTPSSDFFYLTGLSIPPSQRITCLLLTPSDTVLFAPVFELAQLNTDLPDLAREGWPDAADPFDRLVKRLPQTGTLALGHEMKSGWALALQERLPKADWRSANCVLSELRRVKDAQELEILSRAQQMAENALQKLFTIGLQGRTEQEIARILMRLRLEEGFSSVGEGIIASGPNSACPHHRNTDRVVCFGDPVMFDIGGTYQGYHADMTRTIVIGQAGEFFREIYELVLQAHLRALSTVRVGVPAAAVDTAARTVIANAGYGDFFTHRLGHGIGLDIHEEPFIAQNNACPLEVGNVFSDEPGIYLPGKFGVRIENLLAVGTHGAVDLNRMKKDLLVLD